MRLLQILLLTFLISSCGENSSENTMMDDAKDVKEETVSTSIGEIGVTGGVLESDEQKIRLLTESEMKIIQTDVNKSSLFIQKYTGKKLTSTLKDLKLFDASFKSWIHSGDQSKEKDTEVINMLGTILGELMVNELQMEWIIVNDKYGEDWAVQHKKTEVISFPYSSINKRIESNETDFIEPIFYVVEKTIDEKP